MGIDELKAAWNAQSDEYNQYDTLGIDEIVGFAQAVEREACAMACESEHVGVDVWDYCNNEMDEAYNRALRDGAAAIREHSNVKLRGAPLLARPSRTPCWAYYGAFRLLLHPPAA